MQKLQIFLQFYHKKKIGFLFCFLVNTITSRNWGKNTKTRYTFWECCSTRISEIYQVSSKKILWSIYLWRISPKSCWKYDRPFFMFGFSVVRIQPTVNFWINLFASLTFGEIIFRLSLASDDFFTPNFCWIIERYTNILS